MTVKINQTFFYIVCFLAEPDVEESSDFWK
jgi:hypothetical protein